MLRVWVDAVIPAFRLAATARRLFHERGYQAVGVAELCSAADVNKGSFYHFFPSKRHLLLEILSNVWDETGILRTWEQQPPVEPIGEFRRYLRELFAYHYADWEASGQVRGSLLGQCGRGARRARRGGRHRPQAALRTTTRCVPRDAGLGPRVGSAGYAGRRGDCRRPRRRHPRIAHAGEGPQRPQHPAGK